MTASAVVAGSSGVIEFAGTQLSRTVTVTARADGSYEGYETVRLVLSPPAAGSGYWVQSDSAAQLLIYNNDGSSARRRMFRLRRVRSRKVRRCG